MSLTFGFYNSINGDRVYDAIQVSQIFDGIITDGVYATFMKGMVVKASSNASEVIVQPGRCWFNHTWTYIDADYPVEAPAPEVILDRVDALVIDINQENAFRENKLTWVQGTPASINPERPTLINTVTHHQYPLAYIYRKAGTTMIYAADITNAVGTSECPFVTGVLKGLDIDAWLAQWDDEFHTWENTTKTQFEGWMVNQQAVYNTWFNAIKGQMEGDLDEFEDWFETIQGIIDSEAATHLQQEIDDLNDRLPAGSFIEITTTESQLFNRNVTVSDGIHSKTVQFDAYGNATVESFPYVGFLTITSTDGVRTATESLSTPYYARYNVTLAFWSATVNLVGDSSATAGIVVSVYDSESAIPLTSITLDSQGRGSYTATYPDTYKFRYSYGGQTMEVSLAVTQETTYTVEIHAGFNYQAWLTAGRVSGTFASLDAILANEAALRQLMLVHDSVDYLATANVNADVTKIFNNDLAAKWINLSDYALDTFYAVPAIKTVMDTADKYGYGEWCLMPQVPKMTSNTAPYGVASASSSYNEYLPYKAFDGDASTSHNGAMNSQTDTPTWLMYKFPSPVVINAFTYKGRSKDEAWRQNTYKLQGSNDGTNFTDVSDVYTDTDGLEKTHSFFNTTAYEYYRLYHITNDTIYNGYYYSVEYTLQFYAYAPKGNVPVMTSDSAPYGTASSTSNYSGKAAYMAFDGNDSTIWADSGLASGSTASVIYKFVNPTKAKKLYILEDSDNRFTQVYVTASNDGTNYSADLCRSAKTNDDYYDLVNDDYYLYYKVSFIKRSDDKLNISTIQFYGRSLSVSVPTMTSDTAPYGEAIANETYDSGYEAFRAFDNSDSSRWAGRSTNVGVYCGYKFTAKMVFKKLFWKSAASIVGNYIIKGSNDGNTWTPIGSGFAVSGNSSGIVDYPNNATEYSMIALFSNGSNTNGSSFITLQFYGLDYSEKEFEVGTTKKWLYDHGVELETLTAYTYGSTQGTVTKKDSEFWCEKAAVSGSGAYLYCDVDLTQYDLNRIKVRELYSYQGSLAVMTVNSGASEIAHADIINGDYNLPNNKTIDVSSINQAVRLQTGVIGGGDQRCWMSVTEWWLE